MMRVNIPVEDAVFYDPVFTAEDMNGMQALGLSVINGDEAKAALHPLPGPTILFMPHCDIELHQKVLESNWSFSGLRKLLMIGNPLEQYPLTTEKERLETVFSAVGAIAHCRHWDSRAIPDTLSDDKAFVALCVQYIRCDIDENEVSALFAKE
ncbi:hypothetical protein FRC18_005944 [Serendipita sp. 400]|nr:hypothetical protein FRC18_005944 [Serendipita sp. 400]